MAKHKSTDNDSFSYQEPKTLPETTELPDGIFEINTAPKDGTNIVLLDRPEESGVMAYWRRTRGRSGGQWKQNGRWTETLSYLPVAFDPKFWKDPEKIEWKIDASIIDKARIAELEKKLQELSRR